MTQEQNKPLPCRWCGKEPTAEETATFGVIVYCNNGNCPFEDRHENAIEFRLETWNAIMYTRPQAAAALCSESPNISSELKAASSEHSSGEAAAEVEAIEIESIRRYLLRPDVHYITRTSAETLLAALTAAEKRGAEKAEALREQLREAWEAARPVPGCEYADKQDGCCTHPKAMTPECHGGVICPVIEERNASRAAQAREEALEEAARAMCRYCEAGLPRNEQGNHYDTKYDHYCGAWKIRALSQLSTPTPQPEKEERP